MGSIVLQGDPNSIWSAQHKEALKRYMFLFGFGRWAKIRKVSDLLSKVPFESIQPHAISFLKMIYEYLSPHRETDTDMKIFIGKIISKNPVSAEDNEGVCAPDIKNWGGEKISSLM